MRARVGRRQQPGGMDAPTLCEASTLVPPDYDEVPGVYVLHFDRPVVYTTPGTEPGTPGCYGDEQHYIGQSSNVGRRVRRHLRNVRQTPAFVRAAHQQGVPFHLSYVRVQPDEERRLAIEYRAKFEPRRWCGTCKGKSG